MKTNNDGMTLLVPEKDAGENPFPPPFDQVDPAFFQEATAGEEGCGLIRKYCEAVFLHRHGQAREILRHTVAVLGEKAERLKAEYERARDAAKQIPQRIVRKAERLEMPKGGKRWAAFWWGLLFAFMALCTWVNLARFAANETQDWLLGLLYAAPVLFVPLVVKYVDEKASEEYRARIRCLLLGVFLLAFATFAVSFAFRFGYTLTAEDLIRNPTAGSAGDMRVQLLAQIILDPIIALVAYCKIRESLQSGSTEITNPDWLARMAEAARLEAECQEAAAEFGQRKGLLEQLEHSLQAFLLVGESYWHAAEEEREQTERDRQEEEKDFQARQAARLERANRQRQWAAPWPRPGKRNGRLTNTQLTKLNNSTNPES